MRQGAIYLTKRIKRQIELKERMEQRGRKSFKGRGFFALTKEEKAELRRNQKRNEKLQRKLAARALRAKKRAERREKRQKVAA